MGKALPYLIAAAGTGFSAMGQYQAGQAQQQAYQQQARVFEADAVAAKVRATAEEDIARARLKKLIGTQRTLYAKAGVDLNSGSPLAVLLDTVEQGEKDIQLIKYTGDVTAAQSRNKATLARFYGDTAAQAGTISGIGTGVTGLTNSYIGYSRRMLPYSTIG